MKTIIIFFLLFFTIAIFAQEKRDKLFDEVEAFLDQAKKDNADILCASNYNSALKYYLNAKELNSEGNSQLDIRDNLESSISYLTKINDSIDNKREIFGTTMELRNKALANSADKNAGYFWNLAEDRLKDVLNEYDDGEINSAIKDIMHVNEYYTTSVLYSKKAKAFISNAGAEHNAEKHLANILAPEKFKQGENMLFSILNAISSGEKLSEIDKMISDLELLFHEASKQASKYENEFPEVITERQDAKIVEAEKYALETWKDGEQILEKSAKEFEDNNYESANELAFEAKSKYSLAKHTSLKDYFLNDARNEIKLAIDEKAGTYAPITLKRSQDYLAEVTSLINSDSYSLSDVKSLTDSSFNSAKNARYITSVAKRMKPGEHSLEEIILSQQGKSYTAPVSTENKTVPSIDNAPNNIMDLSTVMGDGTEVIDNGDEIIIRLSQVNFPIMSTKLNEKSKISLTKFADALKNYDIPEATIVCYTDNIGTKAMNKALSKKRADAVYNYIKKRNTTTQLLIDGRGEQNPIASNKTFEGRKKNRRIEIEIYVPSEVELKNVVDTKPLLLNEPAVVLNEPAVKENDLLFSLFGFAAVKTIPIEKHFEIDKVFYSGGIEYTKSNWFMGVGAEFTNMLKAMNTDSTRFSTNVYSLYVKLSLTRFAEYIWDFTIDSDLDIYADFGGTYWESKFQKIKYNGIKENYNIEMKSKGYGYLLGFGARYHLYNFIIGVQYHLYHSSKTKFSKTINYTTFDGHKFDLIDTYNVFPGFQQIQILLGYRIRL